MAEILSLKTQELRDMITEYQELEDKSSVIEMQKDVIRTNIKAVLEDEGSNEVACPGVGRFKLTNNRTWSFTDVVKQHEALLEKMKDEEKQKGTATSTEKIGLKYYAERPKS